MILVTGATGSIGRHLVTCLWKQGVPFRALVHSQEKGRELGCDFTVGDFDDPGSIIRALRDVDRLFLNAGGAVPADGEQPMIRQQEAAIDGKLVDGYGGGAVAYIDCFDIAACAAALLTGPGRPAEDFALTGPEQLTAADIAEKLSAALGRAVGHVTLTPGELAATLKARGLPAAFADDVAALGGEVADGALAVTTSAVRDLTGRAPQTFDQFINANVAALDAAWGGHPHGR